MGATGRIVLSLMSFFVLMDVCLSYRLHKSVAGDSSALFRQDSAGKAIKNNCLQICAPIYELCQSYASDLADTFYCLSEEIKCKSKFCGKKK